MKENKTEAGAKKPVRFQTKTELLRMVYAALFLALAIVLPFLTGQNRQLGNMFSLMHLPVLLCGFVCSPIWGVVAGMTAPLLRSLMFGMPPIYPTAIAMACELAVYGCLTGLLYRVFPKKVPFYYLELICAMLAGRVVSGVVSFAILGFNPEKYGFTTFFTSHFVNAWPAVLLQLCIVVPLFVTIKAAGVLPDDLTGKNGKKKAS